jgi:hypothetical protein
VLYELVLRDTIVPTKVTVGSPIAIKSGEPDRTKALDHLPTAAVAMRVSLAVFEKV